MADVEGEILGDRYVPFKTLDLTYKLANYPSRTSLSNSRVNELIAAAFAKWQAASPFKFQPITSDTPDITLKFGSMVTNIALGEAHGVTHAIVFDDSRTWVDTGVLLDLNHPDLLSVAVHEIGHVLGLADNDIAESVMHRKMNWLDNFGKFRGAAIPQVDIDRLK